MPPFTRQHVGRAQTQRLHHESLVKRLASVRNPRQTVRPCKLPRIGFVDCFCGARRHQVNQGRHLGVRDPNTSVEHGVQNPSKRGRGPRLKRRCRRGSQHHGHNVVLPTVSFNQEEALIIQRRPTQVHNGLRLGHKNVLAYKRRFHQHQTVAVQARSWVAIELHKRTHIGACDQIQLVDDHVLSLSPDQSHPCNRCCAPKSDEQGNQFSFHGVRCEWTSKVAYLS